MFRSPVQLWAALLMAVGVLAAVSLIAWFGSGRDGRPEVKRWSYGGDLEETKLFAALVHHGGNDLGEWQWGPSERSVSLAFVADDQMEPSTKVLRWRRCRVALCARRSTRSTSRGTIGGGAGAVWVVEGDKP